MARVKIPCYKPTLEAGILILIVAFDYHLTQRDNLVDLCDVLTSSYKLELHTRLRKAIIYLFIIKTVIYFMYILPSEVFKTQIYLNFCFND